MSISVWQIKLSESAYIRERLKFLETLSSARLFLLLIAAQFEIHQKCHKISMSAHIRDEEISISSDQLTGSFVSR